MKNKIIIGLSVLLVFTVIYLVTGTDLIFQKSKADFFLPKVVFLTTGTNEGNGKLPEGAVIAVQSFNKNGAIVNIDNRNILLKPDELKKYNIMVLPTGGNYHDADRQYSLTFLSDMEMENINNWVKNGGILIAGDNIGRNKIDGTDRTSLFGTLKPDNWQLGNCFGVSLSEKNMKGFNVEGNINEELNGIFIYSSDNDEWALVVDSIYSKNINFLANWTKGDENYPALIQNNCNEGIAFLLPTFYLLHPSNAGGHWNANQIEKFYEYVLKQFYEKGNLKIKLNPWIEGKEDVLCLTFNSAGDLKEYKNIIEFLKNNEIPVTFFVNGNVSSEVKKYLIDREISLASNNFENINLREVDYSLIINQLMMNQNLWHNEFKGFRFPFTRYSYYGMMALNELDYQYDASIGVDNINYFNGTVFPYNIPVSNNGFYKTLNILEISPTINDDYYFFKEILESTNISSDKLSEDAKRFDKYLNNYREYVIKPEKGVMVFIGHPLYSGFNEITMQPLKNLIDKAREENTWITDLDELSNYWNKIQNLRIEVIEKNEKNFLVRTILPENIIINSLTLSLDGSNYKINSDSGELKLKEEKGSTSIIFNAVDNFEIEVITK